MATRPSKRGWPPLSALPWLLLRLGRAGAGRAAGVLTVWILWDRLLLWYYRLRDLRPGGIFRYRVLRYRGAPVELKDGTVVRRRAWIVELHFSNQVLMRLTVSTTSDPWQILHQMGEELDILAGMIERGELGPVEAIHGVTLFAAPGRRFGFEVHDVPHTWAWRLRRYYLIGLLPIYHPDGWKELDRMRRRRWPAELWMSANALSSRVQPPRSAA